MNVELSISERLKLRSQEKKLQEQKRRMEMIRESDSHLAEFETGDFRLSEEQKAKVREYWGRYTESNAEGWVECYSGLYGTFDVRFLPDTVYYLDIDTYYNHREASKYIDHKCYYSNMFPKLRHPEVIAKKINGFWLDDVFHPLELSDIIKRCQKAGKVIIKPAVDFGAGIGIKIWDCENDSQEHLKTILERSVLDTVIQFFIVQNESMEKLHKNSVNTIRIISFYRKGEIRILSSVVRMGIGESMVDNISAGGISVGVLEDGSLKPFGFNKKGTRFEMHPDGAVFSECQVPCYKKICEQICETHRMLPYFRLISWDFAVDRDGEPIFIEANLRNGELDFHQINNGPLFGDLTEEVLQEVYGKRG